MCNIGYSKRGARVRRVPKTRPIIAYRWWEVKRRDDYSACPTQSHLELDALAHSGQGTWKTRDAVADEAPSIRDHHRRRRGLYAFTTRRAALKDSPVTEYPYDTYALGVVELSGRVVEHARGYRAERARIVAIERVVRGHDADREFSQLHDYLAEQMLDELRQRYTPEKVSKRRRKVAA